MRKNSTQLLSPLRGARAISRIGSRLAARSNVGSRSDALLSLFVGIPQG
jgi:hypothetical protein